MITTVSTLSWLSLVLLFIVSLVLYRGIIARLRQAHSGKWTELGQPTLFLNNSAGNSLRMLSFLKNKEFVSLNDVELTKRCSALRSLLFIYLLIFGVAVVATAMMIRG